MGSFLSHVNKQPVSHMLCPQCVMTSDNARLIQEFRAWLVEERTINPETISKDKERKEFSRFVEDFNTGELLVGMEARSIIDI